MTAEPIQPTETATPEHSHYVVGYAALSVIALALVGLACVAAAVFDKLEVW